MLVHVLVRECVCERVQGAATRGNNGAGEGLIRPPLSLSVLVGKCREQGLPRSVSTLSHRLSVSLASLKHRTASFQALRYAHNAPGRLVGSSAPVTCTGVVNTLANFTVSWS